MLRLIPQRVWTDPLPRRVNLWPKGKRIHLRRAAGDDLRPQLAVTRESSASLGRPLCSHQFEADRSSTGSLEHVLGGIALELELVQHFFVFGA